MTILSSGDGDEASAKPIFNAPSSGSSSKRGSASFVHAAASTASNINVNIFFMILSSNVI